MIGILTSPLHKPARVQKPAWLKSLEGTEAWATSREWQRVAANERETSSNWYCEGPAFTRKVRRESMSQRESAKSFAYEAAVSRERMRWRFFRARERTRENSSLDEKVNKAEQRNSNVCKKPGAGRRWRTSRSVERDCIIP